MKTITNCLLFFLIIPLYAAEIDIEEGNTVGPQVLSNGDILTLGGSIDAATGNGITGTQSNTINILSTGVIFNTTDGVNLSLSGSYSAALTNDGLITGSTDAGVDASHSGTGSITIINDGSILSNAGMGIQFEANGAGSHSIINNGLIDGGAAGVNGFSIFAYANGASISMINTGTVSNFDQGFAWLSNTGNSVTAVNSGILRDNRNAGAFVYGLNGTNTFENSGSIIENGGAGVSITLLNSASLVVTNSGVISDNAGHGIDAATWGSSTFSIINDGGAIRDNGGNAINFGNQSESLSIQGFSAITGLIDGNNGLDTLEFANMFLSADKITELENLAAADPTSGTVTLYGETFTFQEFEDIQTSNLQTFNQLVSTPELAGFVNALESLPNLENVVLQKFLNNLAKVTNSESRNEIAASATGLSSSSFMGREASSWLRSHTNELGAYFSQLRLGHTGFLATELPQYDFDLPDHMQEGFSPMLADNRQGRIAEDVPRDEPWSGFFRLSGVLTEFDDGTVNSKSKSGSILLGLDTQVSNNLLLGLYGGYSYTSADTDSLGSKISNHSAHIGTYGYYSEGNTFLQGHLGYRLISYDQDRMVPFTAEKAKSDTTGHQFISSLTLGRDFSLDEERKLTFTPYVSLSYSRLFLDGYHESGSSMNLDIDEQNAHSLRSELGFSVAHRFSGNAGWITPAVKVGWVHEFLDSARDVGTSFLGTNLGDFDVSTYEPDRDFIVAGFSVGGTPAAAENLYISINYDIELGHKDYDSQSLSLSFRLNF